MENPTTLCKLDKSGKIILWSIYWDDKSWWTVYGQNDGAMISTKPTFVEQKNVGKANETSLEEQVLKEVSAKIKKQKDGGYVDLQGSEKLEKSFNVTLAQEYTKRKELNKLQFPYIAQPKLDGIRCYIRWNYDTSEPEMFTRNHKPITSCPHIIRMAKRIMSNRPSAILDGELYNHELKDDFNKICSCVRKQKPTKEELEDIEKTIHFCCFDVYLQDNPKATYRVRNDILRHIILSKVCCYIGDNKDYVDQNSEEGKQLEKDMTPFRFVGTSILSCSEAAGLFYALPDPSTLCYLDGIKVSNEEEVETALQTFIDQGFEGVMLKMDTEYSFTRTTDLLKYKRFKDAEYPIVSFEDGKGNAKGVAVKVVCVDQATGQTFKAGVTGTEEYRKKLFNNTDSYSGKLATIKYQELTPVKDGKGGVPRFGKMMSIRDYE